MTDSCDRYLRLIRGIEGSDEMEEFREMTRPAALGDSYKAFTEQTALVEDRLRVEHKDTLAGRADPVPAIQGEVTDAISTMVDHGQASLGLGLEGEFASQGPGIRNRGAGPEVDAVGKMLSLGLLGVGGATAVYKSEHDTAEGSLGAEWDVERGRATRGDATTVINRIVRNWVLHAHVSDARANKYNKKVTGLQSAGYHLKDRATAGGGEGPSVNVQAALVRADAERKLVEYMNGQKSVKRRGWIRDGYLVAE